MKVGTEDKKKVYVLAVLGVIAAYFVYANLFSDSYSSAPPPKAMTERERIAAEAAGTLPSATVPAPAPSTPATEPRRIVTPSRSRNDEFHPSLRSKRKEDQIDPRTVDPTLRLDLLAKVQAVKLDGGQRNLFQFGKAEAVAEIKGPEPIVKPKREAMLYPQPLPPPTPPPGPTPPPPPPPITFKYYGVATKRIDNKKTAFFLDGEDIILATEGMTVKKRYRVVRINADSVVMEDVELKREQTVKISEDAGGTA